MRIEQIGEFGLIDRLQRFLRTNSERVVLGIGDDAAVIRNRSGCESILTTDALIEKVHFDFNYTPFESLGWKALAVSLSDVAAMGGMPLGALVSIAVPGAWNVEDVEKFYSGFKRCADTFRCPAVGGDTVRSPDRCFISVSVLGEVESGKAVLRSGAKSGDRLCVTGVLGGAKTGLEVLTSHADPESFSSAVRRFLEPTPRLREALALVQTFPVTSMIDISDGLASEIGHLCKDSGVGCKIREDRIPLSDDALRWATIQNRPRAQYLYESGEEYELLFTIRPGRDMNSDVVEQMCGEMNFSVIGEITDSAEGIHIQKEDKLFPFCSKGWDHFGSKQGSHDSTE